jgi:hypothetical protein
MDHIQFSKQVLAPSCYRQWVLCLYSGCFQGPVCQKASRHPLRSTTGVNGVGSAAPLRYERRRTTRKTLTRRGGRVVDRAALEMRSTRKGTGGSNPSLSAILHEALKNDTNFRTRVLECLCGGAETDVGLRGARCRRFRTFQQIVALSISLSCDLLGTIQLP